MAGELAGAHASIRPSAVMCRVISRSSPRPSILLIEIRVAIRRHRPVSTKARGACRPIKWGAGGMSCTIGFGIIRKNRRREISLPRHRENECFTVAIRHVARRRASILYGNYFVISRSRSVAIMHIKLASRHQIHVVHHFRESSRGGTPWPKSAYCWRVAGEITLSPYVAHRRADVSNSRREF